MKPEQTHMDKVIERSPVYRLVPLVNGTAVHNQEGQWKYERMFVRQPGGHLRLVWVGTTRAK